MTVLRLTKWELDMFRAYASAALLDYQEIEAAATPDLKRLPMSDAERMTLARWYRLVKKLDRAMSPGRSS